MRINPNYKLREIADECIIINQGTTNVDMTRIISLNPTAKHLYQSLMNTDFTVEDAANVLTTTYGISLDQAMTDANKWIQSLKDCHIIE